jgi:predicted ester cyclase
MSSVPNHLTEPQARAIIEPWYSMFNQPVRGDIAALHDKAVTPDYQSFTAEGAGESWGCDVSIEVIGSFATSIPDMKFEIKEVLVVGNRVIVRGEMSGTPACALFGGLIPHSGKRFRIMALDIQTIESGKIQKTYHMENWFAALTQLRAT